MAVLTKLMTLRMNWQVLPPRSTVATAPWVNWLRMTRCIMMRSFVAQLKQAGGDDGFLAKLDNVAGELADIAAKINRGDGTL